MRYSEDLPRLALESFNLSQRLCDGCDHFHALWPYLRIARESPAVKAGMDELQSRLADLMPTRGGRVAIAGAGDTGLLALVARAAVGHAESILVLDRCATPLGLCQGFAEEWSLPVQVLKQDLAICDFARRFDLVLAHSVLAFIAPQRRLDVLGRLNRSLAPGGRLVMKFNTGRVAVGAPAFRYSEAIVNALEGRSVPLPEPREAFLSRLDAFGRAQDARERAFETVDIVEALLAEAGFRLESLTPIEINRVASFGYRSEVKRSSFIAVACPEAAP